MRSDIDIARVAEKRSILEVAEKAGLDADDLVSHGPYIAKVPHSVAAKYADAPTGQLVLVTAMTPTPQGEGKTTNTIGLGQALSHAGNKTMVAIREPSLGPCMGLKGGAAGGGYSQVLPMEDINLHFTGDMHAISTAHNLLAAVVDNHLHQRSEPEIHPRKVDWKRVIDMNDRTLRNILVGLQGAGTNGVMREDRFEITAASEIMAILCLASDLADLKRRLGNIIVGYDYLRKPVTNADIGAQGAMTALLKHAMHPNLVQSTENTPVFVHGGPFANIAHGCNSLVATRLALRTRDYVVTEAGFGADLGAEKFFNIKCRAGNLEPSAVVLVVTRRAIAVHGIDNVLKHVESVRHFGVPVVVSINRFLEDSPDDLQQIKDQCVTAGVDASITDFREGGGQGGVELAEKVVQLCDADSHFAPLYDLDTSVVNKIETIATKIYGASGVELTKPAARAIKQIENLGYGNLPICMAKTPASLTDNPKVPGCPSGFTITVSDAKVSAGAGFIVVYTGAVMTMPGLPKHPAALDIDIDESGNISGLF
ncbi:MAG: formate--tetrahydrofolate ligase [Planctomycetota bacterium]